MLYPHLRLVCACVSCLAVLHVYFLMQLFITNASHMKCSFAFQYDHLSLILIFVLNIVFVSFPVQHKGMLFVKQVCCVCVCVCVCEVHSYRRHQSLGCY